MLSQALRLFHTNLEVAEAFLAAAMPASGHASWATGSASALKPLLTRNGWTLHADGLCTGMGNVRFSVRTASASDIASAVNLAWASFVRQAVQHRNGLAHAGVPCGLQTSRVLRMFTVSQQRLLARHITGAFQSGAVRNSWSEFDCLACPWCNEPGTKEHRFLICPAMECVRIRNPSALQILTSQSPEWAHGPYATLLAVQDITHLVFARRPPPAWPPPLDVPCSQSRDRLLTLFTDGGCLHPTVTAARVASWSVVQDTAPGSVPGWQTAARAELCAALQAVRIARASGRPACEVVTDSKCTFGPLFSCRAWHWAQTLCWYESDGKPHTGTTTLELLCNYIVVTGSLPPVCVRHSSGHMVHVEAESVETQLIPVAYRHWLHILVCALKFLQKSMHVVLPPGLHRRKLQTLQPWGDRNPKAGTSSQVTFLEAEATARLLQRVLGHDHTNAAPRAPR